MNEITPPATQRPRNSDGVSTLPATNDGSRKMPVPTIIATASHGPRVGGSPAGPEARGAAEVSDEEGIKTPEQDGRRWHGAIIRAESASTGRELVFAGGSSDPPTRSGCCFCCPDS